MLRNQKVLVLKMHISYYNISLSSVLLEFPVSKINVLLLFSALAPSLGCGAEQVLSKCRK